MTQVAIVPYEEAVRRMEGHLQRERKVRVEIGVTSCPECGTEWERVVTLRSERLVARRSEPQGGLVTA